MLRVDRINLIGKQTSRKMRQGGVIPDIRRCAFGGIVAEKHVGDDYSRKRRSVHHPISGPQAPASRYGVNNSGL